MARPSPPATAKIEQIGRAVAEADDLSFESDPARFRRLALAAFKLLNRPTDAMVDAALEAVSFDGAWAIRGRSESRKAVRAMIRTAVGE